MRGAARDREKPLHGSGPDHRAKHRAGATDDHHGERLERCVDAAALGGEHRDIVGEQDATYR
jgi:hypothetical protein